MNFYSLKFSSPHALVSAILFVDNGGMAMPTDITATIISLRHTTHDTRVFTLRPEVASYRFRPGQHCLLSLEGSRVRPFSFATSPRQGPTFELAIKRIGVLTQQLFALRPGDAVLISQPLISRFRLDEDDGSAVAFIAGGTGITPFMSILRDATLRGAANPLTLLFSNKTDADIIYHAELQTLVQHNPQLRVVYVLSHAWPADWPGERGLVDGAMITRHVRAVRTTRWMVCGPPPMVVCLKKILRDLGVPAEGIAV